MNKKVTLERRAFSIDSFFCDEISFLIESEKEVIQSQFAYIEFSHEETKEILSKVLPADYYYQIYDANNEDDESSYNYLQTLSPEELDNLEQIIDYLEKNIRTEILSTAKGYAEVYQDDEDECFDECYSDQKECYWGTGYHVRSGVYCDEDGDNWEF